MGARPDLEQLIFDANIPFEDRALAVFQYQRIECPPYRRFCDALGIAADAVKRLEDIPHLPISVFKEVDVCTVPTDQVPLRFRSSATGGVRSTHWVAEPDVYRRSIIEGFQAFYGDGPFRFWSYTPGYSENPDSSLIWMIEALMASDLCSEAYRHPIGKSMDVNTILSNSSNSDPIILIGAAFGLLDLIELGIQGILPDGSVVIETGGMKTRRRERTREELHRELSEGFGLPIGQIHSEYGMAEMLSQSYRKEERRKKKEEGEEQEQEQEQEQGQEQEGVGVRMPHWARVDIGHWTLGIGHLKSLRDGSRQSRDDSAFLKEERCPTGTGALQDDNSPAASGEIMVDSLNVTPPTALGPDNVGINSGAGEVASALITDLANLYSCSFLISGDRMTINPDGSFEVHGRVDETDFRGCNFLMERD